VSLSSSTRESPCLSSLRNRCSGPVGNVHACTRNTGVSTVRKPTIRITLITDENTRRRTYDIVDGCKEDTRCPGWSRTARQRSGSGDCRKVKSIDRIRSLTDRTGDKNTLKTLSKDSWTRSENRPGKINSNRHENKVISKKSNVEPVHRVSDLNEHLEPNLGNRSSGHRTCQTDYGGWTCSLRRQIRPNAHDSCYGMSLLGTKRNDEDSQY